MTQGLFMPDATALDPESIQPQRDFETCNYLLGDAAATKAFYEDKGYLFFRDVLDPGSIARARDAMLAIAADRFGIIAPGDTQARWNGRPLGDDWFEEDPVFAGISRQLVEDARNQDILSRCLGEPICMVPNVNYRLYPPGGPVTNAHQDGFFSPGIEAFRPLWIPLVEMPRSVGGLTVAVGEHKRGFFHNLAPGKQMRIPAGVIDPGSWATADYMPGDLLVVHPFSPHAGMPNRSDRVRVSLDVRIQSAAHPTAFAATVSAVTPNSITLAADDDGIGEITLSVDEGTFIRVLSPGVREPFESFTEYTVPGMHLTIVRDGDRAMMLRSGSQP